MNKVRMISVLVIVALISNVHAAYAAYTMTDLGTLGGLSSEPVAINEAGQVIGYSYLAGDDTQHGFIWDSGVMTDLGTTLVGGPFLLLQSMVRARLLVIPRQRVGRDMLSCG